MLYTQKIKFCMQKFFFRNMFFEYEYQFAFEKTTKKNFGGNFKNTLQI